MTLDEFNKLNTAEADELLEQCCAAPKWIQSMRDARPFKDGTTLKNTASTLWNSMDEKNLLEAFFAHPRIGNVESLQKKFANTKTIAAGEQAGAAHTSQAVLQALADKNEMYFEKFGFIFIVFATGKSAEEMLELLEQRLPNDRDEELKNAAAEQFKITALRLNKFIDLQ